MYEQLLLHLFGDFILQNDKIALNKKNKGLKGFYYCFVHCLIYTLPFLLITNWKVCIGIFITHFTLDRTHIVEYFLAIRNNVKDETTYKYSIKNFGFNKERPFAITIWLMIITDNTFHLIFNYLFIKYLCQ